MNKGTSSENLAENTNIRLPKVLKDTDKALNCVIALNQNVNYAANTNNALPKVPIHTNRAIIDGIKLSSYISLFTMLVSTLLRLLCKQIVKLPPNNHLVVSYDTLYYDRCAL